jgi:hypothetical protein
MMMKRLTPGTKAPISGEYRPYFPNGTVGNEVTAIQGKPLPPTKVAGTIYKPTRAAQNGAGKPKR